MYTKIITIAIITLFSLVSKADLKCSRANVRGDKVCRSGEGFLILNEKSEIKIIRENERWLKCIESNCVPVKKERKNLYYETLYAVKLKDFSKTNTAMNSPLVGCTYDELSFEKSRQSSSVVDIDSRFQARIDAINSETNYHMSHYNNLLTIIEDYNKNYEGIVNKEIVLSSNYNKYEKPVKYLSDLSRSRLELIKSKSNLEWLVRFIDISDHNINLNLNKNKIIKGLFDEFKLSSGFPNNIDELKKEIDKKIKEIDDEEEKILSWVRSLEKDKIDKLARTASLLGDFGYDEQERSLDLQLSYNREISSLIKEGQFHEAKSKIDEVQMQLSGLEGIMGLQLINQPRAKELDALKKMNQDFLDTQWKTLDKKISESKDKSSIIDLRITSPNNVENSVHDEDRIPDEDGGVLPNDGIVTIEGGSMRFKDGRRFFWFLPSQNLDELNNDGAIMTRKDNEDNLVVSVGNEYKNFPMGSDDTFKNEVTGSMTDLGPEHKDPLVKDFFRDIAANKDHFNNTSAGRRVLAFSKRIEGALQEGKRKQRDAINNINNQIKRSKPSEASRTKFPEAEKPVNQDDVDTDASEIAKYATYYGISFTPVIGNAVNLVELINMLMKQQDFLGNDTDSVDFTIQGLSLLIPQLKALKGAKPLVKALQAFLKKHGKEGIKILAQLVKSGKIGTVVDQAIEVSKKGVNVFSDLPPPMWAKASKIVDSAGKLLSKVTPDSVKNYTKALTKIGGNNVDNVNKSLGKGTGVFGEMGTKTTREALDSAQIKNLKRFEKKLPAGAKETKIRDLGNGTKVFQAEVPGNVPGSKAIYEKTVNASGKTEKYLKTTYDNKGKVVHIKDKVEGDVVIPGDLKWIKN